MAWWPDGGVWMMMTMTIISFVQAEEPYRFLDFRVTYGKVALFENIPPSRGNSYQDGVYGTTCPIPPGKNYTYAFHVGDQVGSFFYFPSLAVQKAAGGYGAIRILSRPDIPVPFPQPAGDFTLLIGDFYDGNDHKARLDGGRMIPRGYGVVVNGDGNSASNSITVDKGKTYRFRISNVGLQLSLSFKILYHMLKLVEVEGTYTIQSMYTSLDIHVGQSFSVLVTMDQPPKNYSIVVHTRFTEVGSTHVVILNYSSPNSKSSKSGPNREQDDNDIDLSIKQARSIKTNLTASGQRQNAQGSSHYGRVKISRTLILESSAGVVNRKQRYGINGVSFVPADTPLKLAYYFKIKGVYKVGSIPDKPGREGMRLETAVMGVHHKDFIEIVFQNREKIIQTYHLDGHNFWVVG
ncbi:SKU5 similar 9 [Raphanus sativus]|nr:SKU5 similar 9 [Raphanus sativus]